MSAPPRIPIAFRPRAAPLVPTAAAARGPAAVALAVRLLGRDDAALGRLSGVSGPGLILVLGQADELPWVDGAVYLGRDPAAPSLLLPTALAPDVPAPLLERALLARAPDLAPPLAVLVDPPLIVGTGVARPVRRAELSAFLDGGLRPPQCPPVDAGKEAP
jgi:hypothetical protein